MAVLEISLIALALVFSCISFFWIRKVERRLTSLFAGKESQNLEELLRTIKDTALDAEQSVKALEAHVRTVEGRLQRSVQKVQMVRFNPFKDSGSDQSFAVAFLDEKNTGAILSSIYSREGVRVYAKPITKGESQYPLSEEETDVLKRAIAMK
jgi:hypothetical protein